METTLWLSGKTITDTIVPWTLRSKVFVGGLNVGEECEFGRVVLCLADPLLPPPLGPLPSLLNDALFLALVPWPGFGGFGGLGGFGRFRQCLDGVLTLGP